MLRSVEFVSGSETCVLGETLPRSSWGGVTGVVAPVLPLGDTELGVTGCCEVVLLLLLDRDCTPDDKLAFFIIRFALYCAIPENIHSCTLVCLERSGYNWIFILVGQK